MTQTSRLVAGLITFVVEISLPKPMFLPRLIVHFFNGNTFGLREKGESVNTHNHNPSGKEEEDPSPHMT